MVVNRWPLFSAEPPEINAALERRMVRVLRVVHELHKRGYQRLRVVPHMASGNTHWRCWVVPARFVDPVHRMDGVEKLASKFQERFGELCEHGAGSNWAYAGWYVQMLGAAERGAIPVAADDKHGVFREHIPALMGSMPDVLLLPLPR